MDDDFARRRRMHGRTQRAVRAPPISWPLERTCSPIAHRPAAPLRPTCIFNGIRLAAAGTGHILVIAMPVVYSILCRVETNDRRATCRGRRLVRPSSRNPLAARMQSTGQGATHNSQPVHFRLDDRVHHRLLSAVDGVDRARRTRQCRQPIHNDSSIIATCRCSGGASCCSGNHLPVEQRSASRSEPWPAPPGGHRLIGARHSRRRPSAYGLQPG